jgi:hypothetical protein
MDEKGTRCKSGAVPAAVSFEEVCFYPQRLCGKKTNRTQRSGNTPLFRKEWEGARTGNEPEDLPTAILFSPGFGRKPVGTGRWQFRAFRAGWLRPKPSFSPVCLSFSRFLSFKNESQTHFPLPSLRLFEPAILQKRR